ncbi:AraC family transcriptional regulator [Burkholderia territorii]|uniref:AraC family transcriptional regulator n=1 Tax=Burkholderia territorii TaxID=1503055 RepID=UPI000A59637F|nr:AraC family transcriptional regulator [Burkholderia territorii]
MIDRSPAAAGRVVCVDCRRRLRISRTGFDIAFRGRLREEGACFRGVSNGMRKTRAWSLVAEGRLSIEEIAEAPRFSDMSSFAQAYKRQAGVAPCVSRQAGTHSWRA